MNCTELDGVGAQVQTFVIDDDVGFGVAVAALALTSIVLLVYGHKLIRPLCALLAGAGAAVGVYVLTGVGSMPCEARLAVAGASALVAALLALCLLKTGLFVLGATALGTVAHFVYESLPLGGVPSPFVLFERSAYYYLALLVAGVLGGVLAVCQRTQFVRIASAMIGGAGIAFASRFVAERGGGVDFPALAVLAIFVSSVVAGVAAQCQIERCKTRRRRRRVEDEYSRRSRRRRRKSRGGSGGDEYGIAVGEPV